ncbi:hypothetical protein [Flagellimonas sp.]|uniref:hypothetical protein n=1 Tax=Flagellimonas sp. TaxID=2058762 RepID=UPI003B512945
MAGKHWIIIVIIIIAASYGIYSGVEQLKYGREIWTVESRGILIDKCMQDAKEMAAKYRELTFEYCVCSTEKIQAEFTQQEYIEIGKESIEKQEEKLLPAFKSCLTNYQQKVNQAKTN